MKRLKEIKSSGSHYTKELNWIEGNKTTFQFDDTSEPKSLNNTRTLSW